MPSLLQDTHRTMDIILATTEDILDTIIIRKMFQHILIMDTTILSYAVSNTTILSSIFRIELGLLKKKKPAGAGFLYVIRLQVRY